MLALKVEWVDGQREPQCPPNPDYPDGKPIDMTVPGQRSCFTELPYPAKRCGYFVVTCETCGLRVAITTAGRPDDPKSARLGCQPRKQH